MDDTVMIYRKKLRDDPEGAAWLLGYTEGKAEAYSSAVLMEEKNICVIREIGFGERQTQ